MAQVTKPRGKAGRERPWMLDKRQLRKDGAFLRFKLGKQQEDSAAQAFKQHVALIEQTPLSVPHEDDESRAQVKEDDEMAIPLINNGVYEKSKMGSQIGGIRQDPFKTLPIDSTGLVPYAFDYYATSYAPTAMRAANFDMETTSLYLRDIMQDPMAFEACIAYALTLRRLQIGTDSRVSQAILYHSGKGMTALRKRLVSGSPLDATSDMVIWTILALCVVNHFTGNDKAAAAHMNAILQVIALRGGVENLLGFNGYLRHSITQLLAIWAAYQRQLRDKEHESLHSGVATRWLGLTYPKHPFPPDLCQKISEFSSGFRELALSRKLSIEFIDYLHVMVVLGRSEIVAQIPDILGSPNVTGLERMLLITLAAYTICMKPSSAAGIATPVHTLHLQAQTKLLMADPELLEPLYYDADAVAWTCLVLEATNERESEVSRWAHVRLDEIQMTDRRMQLLGQAFLPVEELPTQQARGSPTVEAGSSKGTLKSSDSADSANGSNFLRERKEGA